MTSTRRRNYEDNNQSVHNQPRNPPHLEASHPLLPPVQNHLNSIHVEDALDQRAFVQSVLLQAWEPDDIRHFMTIMEDQARLI
jgi:hypothetical protein